MASPVANALAPIFIGLIAGYLAGRRKIVDPANVGPLVTFTMSFALPCSLFTSIERTPPGILPQLKWIALALAVTYIMTYAVLYALSRRALRSSVSDGAVLALTIAFPNVAAFGPPLLSAIYGPSAADSAAIALAVGAVTISPATLALLETEHEQSDGRHNVKLISVWWHACTKPVVWAPLMGVVALLLPWHLPFTLERTLDISVTPLAHLRCFSLASLSPRRSYASILASLLPLASKIFCNRQWPLVLLCSYSCRPPQCGKWY